MVGRFPVLLIVLVLVGCTPQVVSTYEIGGQALAGPTCPVQPASPLPGECAPRPVVGAVLVINDRAGHEVIRATTGSDGRWSATIPAGSYTIIPGPVPGLLETAQLVVVMVSATSVPTNIEIDYGTGLSLKAARAALPGESLGVA